MSAWRDFDDDPPPLNEMVIYCQKRGHVQCVGLAYLAKDGYWRDSEGNWNERLRPSHWIPLPDPPEQSADRRR